MSFLTNKGIVQKIVIALVIVILFEFVVPNISQAADGTTLFAPIRELLLWIADSVIGITQSLVLGIDSTFLELDNSKTVWSKIAGVVTGVLVGAALIGFSVATGGIGAAAVAAAAATAAGSGYVVSKVVENELPSNIQLPMFALSPEEIFKGEIKLLDVNFFDPEESTTSVTIDGQEYTNSSLAEKLQPTISKWYYALRNIVVVILLCILVYVGIRIVISSAAEDRAKYKQRLMDWLVAMCLLFFMHYFMYFAVVITEELTSAISSLSPEYYIYIGNVDSLAELGYKYENGDAVNEGSIAEAFEERGIIEDDRSFVWPTNMMGKARIELQLEPTDETSSNNILMRQFGYTVIYLALVIYTILFLFRYLKRSMMLIFLTIMAPLMALTYPLDKMRDGSAQGFNMWLKEYVFNLLIQPVHLILYTVLIGSAFDLVVDNLIYALVALGFILQAEKLLRRFFGFDKASTVPGGSAFGGAMAYSALQQAGRLLGRGGKGGRDGKGNTNNERNNNTRQRLGADKDKDTNALTDSVFGAQALDSGDSDSGNEETPDRERQNIALEADNTEDHPDNGGSPIDTGNDEKPETMRDIEKPETMRDTEKPETMRDPEKPETMRDPEKPETLEAPGTPADATKPARLTGQRGVKVSEKGKNKEHKTHPKARYAGKLAARGITGAVSLGARTFVKGTAVGAGAVAGLTAALVSDDFSNVGKYTVGGAAAGWAVESGVHGVARGIGQSGQNAVRTLAADYESSLRQSERETRQNVRADSAALKDKDRIALYQQKLGVSKARAKEIMSGDAQRYREYGITDDKLIIKAMKTEGFGEGMASPERIELASVAQKVENGKQKLDDVEKGIQNRLVGGYKSRGVKDEKAAEMAKEEAARWAKAIKNINGIV